MNEITRYKFHDILFKFFMSITLLCIGMLSLDIISLLHRIPLFWMGKPMTGYYTIIPLLPVILGIILGYWLTSYHRKHSIEAKWR